VSGSNGQSSYSAWWELIPAPSVTIDSLSIHPCDHMHASIAETVPNANVRAMSLQDITTG
jgi:peptidase A4-like protein